MRHFVVLAALLGLTACGGEMLPEEDQTPATTQEAAPAQEAGPDSMSLGPCPYKTQATCNAVTGCFWYQNRCQPTYE